MSFTRSRLAIALAATLTTGHATAAEFGFFDARSAGMGNAGVASGTLSNAAYHNPALLAAQKPEKKFALLIPAVGIRVGDPNNLVDDIDAFQAATTDPARIAALNAANGKALIANATGGVALAVAGERFASGIVVTSYSYNSLQVNADIGTPLNSTLGTVGYEGTEIGIPLAWRFGDSGFAVGITPKYVRIRTNDATQLLSSVDTASLFDSAANQTEYDNFNVDAGLVWGKGNGFRIGVVGRNLVAQDYVTTGARTIALEPQYRAGVAYVGDWVTVAADMDLRENNAVGFESPTRMASVGLEFNVFNALRLRVGAMQNLKAASTVDKEGLLTAGLGFNFFGVHADLAAMTNGNNNDAGVFFQMGMQF